MVGKSIELGGEPYTVVGIVARSFSFDPAPDLWLPFQFDLSSTDQAHYFLAAGRLKPGVTIDGANARLKLVAKQYRRKYPLLGPDLGFAAQPLRDAIVSDVRTSLLVLLAAVALVLPIACANVANLLLVRATARKREIAIRAALGARCGRIIRQLLTESLLLSAAGGLLGLLRVTVAVRSSPSIPATFRVLAKMDRESASTGPSCFSRLASPLPRAFCLVCFRRSTPPAPT